MAASAAAASADPVEDAVVDHVGVVAASAVVSHLATTATNQDTLPVNAPNLEPRLATTVARTDTFPAIVTLLTTVELVVTETEAAIATAAANLDTFLAIAPMVAVTLETDASAMLAVVLVTFLVIAINRARTVVEMMVKTNLTTDSR